MNNKIYDLIVKFRNLSDEEQNTFIKEIIMNGYLNDYVDYKVDNYIPPISTKSVQESAKTAYKERLEDKIDKTIDQTLDQLRSSDKKLKYNIFDQYLDNFDGVIQKEKTNICGEVHDFSPWTEKTGERPTFDKTGDIVGFCFGTWFERKCDYCGMIQKAWDVGHKNKLDEEHKSLKLRRGSSL